MSHRVTRRAAIGVIVAGLLAPTATTAARQGHNPFPATPSTPGGGHWELVDQRELAFAGELVALSPDGQWIAGIAPEGNRFCVWNVATGDVTCDEQVEPVHQESIAWAPDSSAVAYSLNALVQFNDSDIFVFDIAAGKSTNLTDDGYRDRIPLDAIAADVEQLPVDVYPAWYPDSQALVFARTVWTDASRRTELLTVDRAGGEPVLLDTAHPGYPWAVSAPMFVLEDGALLYPVWLGDPDDDANGIWRRDPDGTKTQLMRGHRDEAFPNPALVDVQEAEDGIVASGYSRWLVGQLPETVPIAFELDLASGEVTPVAPATAESGSYRTVPRYGPDGASTIAIDSHPETRNVVITGPAGGTLDLGEFEGGRYIHTRGLDWAANNTILVPTFAHGGTLLTVALAR